MAIEEHSRLIRDAARTALLPLGFRQKGQSRIWIADRGYWALVVEFQPSGFSKGSYLNICATWLWHSDGLPLNYLERAGGFIEFETTEQFKPEAERLANIAAVEMTSLDRKFETLEAVAAYLKAQSNDEQIRKNPWTLYDAAIAAGLTGDQKFGLKCFEELMARRAHADWMREMQAEATTLATLLAESGVFHPTIQKKVAAKRSALKLPPLSDAP